MLTISQSLVTVLLKDQIMNLIIKVTTHHQHKWKLNLNHPYLQLFTDKDQPKEADQLPIIKEHSPPVEIQMWNSINN